VNQKCISDRQVENMKSADSIEIARAAVTLQHRIFLFRAASGAKVMAGCSLALGRLEKVGELLPLEFNELVSGVVFRLRLRLCKLLAKNIVFALDETW